MMTSKKFSVRGAAKKLGAAALTACGLMVGLADTARAADGDLLTLGVGQYDVIHNENDTGAAQIEYLSGRKLWVLNPFVGLMGTLDSAVYGYAGLAYDWNIGRNFVITPSFAAGLYAEGDGRDLGSPIEFRSAIQFAYRFENDVRAGLLFYHLSNAGLDERNPGVEVLMATYAIPLGRR